MSAHAGVELTLSETPEVSDAGRDVLVYALLDGVAGSVRIYLPRQVAAELGEALMAQAAVAPPRWTMTLHTAAISDLLHAPDQRSADAVLARTNGFRVSDAHWEDLREAQATRMAGVAS